VLPPWCDQYQFDPLCSWPLGTTQAKTSARPRRRPSHSHHQGYSSFDWTDGETRGGIRQKSSVKSQKRHHFASMSF
jgi:hypothetical protein